VDQSKLYRHNGAAATTLPRAAAASYCSVPTTFQSSHGCSSERRSCTIARRVPCAGRSVSVVRRLRHGDRLLPRGTPSIAATRGHVDVYHDDLSNHREALSAYNKAYGALVDTTHAVTDPPPEPRFILSQLQYRIGLCISHDLTQKCAVQGDDVDQLPTDCEELAAHAFSLAVEYDPDNESAKHMLATITADATLKRASNDYVTSLFNDYAKNFEHSLVNELGYTGFERLRHGFDRAFAGEDIPLFDLVVDAGCGTGLVGEQFRNVSKTLIGVDLSEAILEQAVRTRPGLYDEVLVGDATKVFHDRKPISLIIAGDSFIYFGDLDPLFESIQDGLGISGYVAFTLENVAKDTEITLTESKPDWRWQLTASGRFAHRKEYVLDVGKRRGLELVHYESIGTLADI
jgi:predicted TPR repeat methyltransferase